MIVTKEWTFDAAHRLVNNYPGKCAHLHGHTYRVQVAIECPDDKLSSYGFVVDFDAIKSTMKEWTMEKLDHATIVSAEDTPLVDWLRKFQQKHYVMPVNPSAENIAAVLFEAFEPRLSHGRRLRYVRVWETPDSSACKENA